MADEERQTDAPEAPGSDESETQDADAPDANGAAEAHDGPVPPPPRPFPAELSSTLVKQFAKIALIGLVLGGVLLGIGLYLEDDFRELQEMRYYGDYVEAEVVGGYADEEGNWANVIYEYKGQIREAKEIELTDETWNRLNGLPSNVPATLPVVVWPDEPNWAVSVEFIDARSTFFSFAWAYWASLCIVAIALVIAFRKLLRLRRRYRHGHVTWARQIGPVHYNDETTTFTTRVEFDVDDRRGDGVLSWKAANEPVSRSASGERLVIVEPDRYVGAIHPVDETTLRAMKDG